MATPEVKSKFTVSSAIDVLARNGVKVSGVAISDCHNKGIRVWAAIDYLTNYCGYKVVGGGASR